MARLKSATFELNSVSSGVEININATPSIVTSPVFSGSRALALNTTAVSGIIPTLYASDQARICYVGFALYMAVLPSANVNPVIVRSTAAANLSRLNITSAGLLGLRNSVSGVPTGSGTYTLSTGRWYWIEYMHDATTSPGALEVRVFDSSQCNLLFRTTGANDIQGSWANVRLGVAATVTSEFYLDNVIINDDTGTSENTWVGAQKLLCLRPNAAGDFNQLKNTANAAGSSSNYTLVNESPPDEATSLVQSGTLNDTDMYGFDDGGLDTHDIIRAVSVNARLRNNTADATLAGKVQLMKASGGTVLQSAAIIPNTTTWLTDNTSGSVYQPAFITAYTDPDGAAWTSGTIDSLQAGLKITTAGTQRLHMTAMWVVVSYVKQRHKASDLLAVV